MEVLKKLSNDFEIILFTDGQRELHTKILDKIDPKNELFTFRLFKDHCYCSDKGYYTKDLRMINRPLNSMVLVDNSTTSFGFQLSNGIPIIPYTGDNTDCELMLLCEYMMYLKDKQDVRHVNKQHFKFDQYIGCDSITTVYKRLFKRDD